MGTQAQTKRCSRCGQEKPTIDFYVDRRGPRPYARCKACISIIHAAKYRGARSGEGRAQTGQDRHRWLWKQPLDGIGHCSICGVVRLYPKTDGQFRCPNAVRQQHATYRFRKRGMLNVPPYQPADACAICATAAKTVLDHSHKTGKARGWLCHHCNIGLAWFKDEASWLRKAADYLESPPLLVVD